MQDLSADLSDADTGRPEGAPRSAGAARPEGAPGSDGAALPLPTLAALLGPTATVVVRHRPARAGRRTSWPGWVPPEVRAALDRAGVTEPWEHQADAMDAAWSGRSVVIATGTASGKSLCYQVPLLTAALAGGTSLYLAPTKALAADQLRSLQSLRLTGARIGMVDGDTSRDEQQWAQLHAHIVLTNPDKLHASLLPQHDRWSRFWRRLRFVVLDESHHYRGLFGAHVAAIARRITRIAQAHGADPVFLLTSATLGAPQEAAERLTGRPCVAITDDASARGAVDVALAQPPLLVTPDPDDPSADLVEPDDTRQSPLRSACEAAAALIERDRRVLVFVRSRRGAEGGAALIRGVLGDLAPHLVNTVAAYRGGYLPEDRRALERGLQSGAIRCLVTTNALEMGIDVAGLDAVVAVGWPGSLASLWQQFGRAGRRADSAAVAVFIARDDPLDTYLVEHPATVFDGAVEHTAFDLQNPYVMAPHLCAAAAEVPLHVDEVAHADGTFGDAWATVHALTSRRLLRQRGHRFFWVGSGPPSALASIRGSGATTISLALAQTGDLLGTMDAAAATRELHPGAIYVHQGRHYLVTGLDLDTSVATLERANPPYTTHPEVSTRIDILETVRSRPLPGGHLHYGRVLVTSAVTGFRRTRRGSGEFLGMESLDLPEDRMTTSAVWWTIDAAELPDPGESVAPAVAPADRATAAEPPGPAQRPRPALTPASHERQWAGAAHAAEHCSIGLLPLLANCDRNDLGGLSAPVHQDTGLLTVFVHDAVPGGSGFALAGYEYAEQWLGDTLDRVRRCTCQDGCPACVISPKCGNGNRPLDKAGAAALLAGLLRR